MTKEPEYKKLQRMEKLIYRDTMYATDTASAAIKNSINSNFIIPFAIAMNSPNSYIAMISSAPQVIGSFFQLFSADLMNIVKKRKSVIVATALIDAILWIPILLIPFLWQSDYVLLLNFLVLQAIALSLLRPFYNSLLGDVIPQKKRGSVIGRINKISSVVSFVSTIIFGLVLNFFTPINPFIGFGIIFFVAFFSRVVSAYVKSKYYEPKLVLNKKNTSLFNFGKNIRKTNFGKFVLYDSLIWLAVGISSPFFAVYMLKSLNFDFLTYSVVNSASVISSMFVYNKWGRTIDKKGSKKVLEIAGMIMPLVPILWIIFKNPIALILVQLASGAVWSAYKLSTSNFVMDATDRKNRLMMNSYYNFFLGMATFLGAMIGGILMSNLPLDFFGNLFYFVFGLSGLLRFIVSLNLLPKIREEKFIDIEVKGPKSKRAISITPQQGVEYDYIPRKR